MLKGLVRAAFGQRRKTLSNARGDLAQDGKQEVDWPPSAARDIDPKRRGETLTSTNLSNWRKRSGIAACCPRALEVFTGCCAMIVSVALFYSPRGS